MASQESLLRKILSLAGAWQITMPNVTTAEQSYPQVDLQPEESNAFWGCVP